MRKPVTMWAVVDPQERIDKFTLCCTRKGCLSLYGKKYWNKLRKLGYRAVKVRVEVVE